MPYLKISPTICKIFYKRRLHKIANVFSCLKVRAQNELEHCSIEQCSNSFFHICDENDITFLNRHLELSIGINIYLIQNFCNLYVSHVYLYFSFASENFNEHLYHISLELNVEAQNCTIYAWLHFVLV